jgi:hypothetical protein
MKTSTRQLAMNFLVLMGLVLFLATSCQTVKPYQKSYLNDSAMQMGFGKNAGFEHYSHMIREGSNGAGGKNSGGCGCN